MKSCIIFISSVSLGILALFPANFVRADTLISSNIGQNNTWTKENSPYIISNNPIISADVTLTINPGTTVEFDNSSLTVFGNIIGTGTAQDQIVFTSVSGTQSPTGFLGINFISSSATSSFAYVSIKNLANQLFAYNSTVEFHNSSFDSGKGIAASNSSVAISDTSFTSIAGTALAVYSTSSSTCSHCVFDGAGATEQPNPILVYNSSSFDLENSSIIHSGSGSAISAYGDSGSGPTILIIADSTIDTGAGDGITAYNSAQVKVTHSTVTNFADDGILAYNGVTLSVVSSTIEKNNGGLNIFGDLTGSVTSSSIKNNVSYGITSRTALPFQAENNWWGDASGPFNSLENATGTANSVSSQVDFTPDSVVFESKLNWLYFLTYCWYYLSCRPKTRGGSGEMEQRSSRGSDY